MVNEREHGTKAEFRTALRLYRERLGISQEELAARVGKSQQWVAKVERGDQSVKLEDAAELARAVDRPLASLLDSADVDLVLVSEDGGRTREELVEEMETARKQLLAATEAAVQADAERMRRLREIDRLNSECEALRLEETAASDEERYWSLRYTALEKRLMPTTERRAELLEELEELEELEQGDDSGVNQ